MQRPEIRLIALREALRVQISFKFCVGFIFLMAAYHDEFRRDIAVDSVIFHVVPRLTVVSGHRIQNIDFFIDGQQPHRPVARTRTAADIQRRCRDCAGLPCREGKLRAHQKNTADYRE